MLSGNQAVALGALVAGCRRYAGYPITPATDIMEFLADELPKVGGAVVQAEDEIAAIGMVLGASYAGKKSMTATSGPGISLMTEMLGSGQHGRDPGRGGRLPARRPVDGHADPPRAGRPEPGASTAATARSSASCWRRPA